MTNIEELKTVLLICIIIFIVVFAALKLIKYFDKQFIKQDCKRHLNDIIIGDTYVTTITYNSPFIAPENIFCIIDDIKVNTKGVVWVKYHYCHDERIYKKYYMESATSFLSKFVKVENTNN